jgi:hypothetical protein
MKSHQSSLDFRGGQGLAVDCQCLDQFESPEHAVAADFANDAVFFSKRLQVRRKVVAACPGGAADDLLFCRILRGLGHRGPDRLPL